MDQEDEQVVYMESEFKQTGKFQAYQKLGQKYSKQVNVLKNREKLG